MAISSATVQSVKSLLTTPSSGASPSTPKPTQLDSTQTASLNSLITHFGSPEFVLPSNLADFKSKDKSKSNVCLSEWEKCSILNREALVRCLKADKWDLVKCTARIEETIVWRRDCGCHEMDISEEGEVVKQEAETGKMFVLGYDNVARPIVHMRPRYQNTNVSPKRLQFAFWLIDRAIDLMPPGVESILIVIDLAGPQESPSIKQQRDFVRTLGAHYCERLGQALVLNMPSVFVWFLKLVRPFIDPVTFSKAVFDKADPLKFAPAEQLDASVGGSNGYEFDIQNYWPALMEECTQRRRERLDKWIMARKEVGSSELETEESIPDPMTTATTSDDDQSASPSIVGDNSTPPTTSPSVCSRTQSNAASKPTVPVTLVSQ